MDNKDFDKLFSEKLSETQSFDYMEADWDNVAGRLSQPKKKKRNGGGWLWLFGLGFLFMAGTSIYLANTLNKTNKHLVELKTAVAELEQERRSETAVEKVDTIFKQVTITQYDTVNSASIKSQIIPRKSVVGNEIENKNIDEYENETSTSNVNTNGNSKSDLILIPNENVNTNIKSTSAKALSHTLELDNNYKAIKTKTKQETITENIYNNKIINLSADEKMLGIESLWMRSLSSSLLSDEVNLEPIDDLQEVPALVKKNKKKKLAWKYLSIGVTGGSFLSRELSNESEEGDGSFDTREANNSLFGPIALKNRYGWDVGLMLQYQLSTSFSLTGSVHFQRNIYSGNEGGVAAALQAISSFDDSDDLELALAFPSEGNGSNSPIVEYGSPYTFKQSMIAYRLGTNYNFRKNKKWRPYLGLSLSATSVIKQTLYASESSPGSQPNYTNADSFNKIAESKSLKSSFRFTGIVPTAGFQLALNPKMNWQMEAWYRQGFNKDKDYLYGLLGLRTGLSYRF